MPSGPHDEFLELCAVSTTGELSPDEAEKLREHLFVCPSCREVLRQYEAIHDEVLPKLDTEEVLDELDPGPGWSQSHAERAFFARLAEEEKRGQNTGREEPAIEKSLRRMPSPAPNSTWRHVWMLYAAGMLLFATLGLSAYWLGVRRGNEVAAKEKNASLPDVRTEQASLQALEAQLSDAAHERAMAQAEIAKRDQSLANLHQQLERQSSEMSRMQQDQVRLESELRTGEAGKQEVAQQRSELATRLQTMQEHAQALQQQIHVLDEQSTQDTVQAKGLEGRVQDLTEQLKDREATIEQQEQLLAHDRDIRELMGARDLYIAEVYDVGDNGATQKPYGRVFYTKGKSLIFYAYDLDQQAGLKLAKTFQAWGRRGPDRQQALNLGIFYQDNASQKRWVLKFNDPRTLAQIDAVFVTLEPNGQSHKPSGKPLLFAYLGVNPNHP